MGVGWPFKTIHFGDTPNLVDPDTLPTRLQAAGSSRARSSVAAGRPAGARLQRRRQAPPMNPTKP